MLSVICGLCSDINDGFIYIIDSCPIRYVMAFKLFCDPVVRLYDLEFCLVYYTVVIISVFALGFGHPWD